MMHVNQPLWDDHPWAGLPRLEGHWHADVVVIGLGGSGLNAVLEARRLGLRVIGLDAALVAGGAAGRNGGFVMAGVAKFYHQRVADLGRERTKAQYGLTLEEIGRQIALTPQAIRRTGSLRVASDAAELEDCHAHLEALQADGFNALEYRGPEGRGVFIASDAAMNPLLRCRLLAARALEAGAALFEHSPVTHIASGIVHGAHFSVQADHVVACVDGKLERLFPSLELRVRTARLQMLGTAPTDEVYLPRPVYARWGYEYWQQLQDGRVVLGGFRDAEINNEWTLEDTPSDSMQTRLEAFLRERIGVNAAITHRWAASVSYADQPILEEVMPQVWAVGAYSGTGNIVGALCGRAAMERAVRGGSSVYDVLFG
jgi:glycine/D-amino acid oxidase-like deaminating enzyme